MKCDVIAAGIVSAAKEVRTRPICRIINLPVSTVCTECTCLTLNGPTLEFNNCG